MKKIYSLMLLFSLFLAVGVQASMTHTPTSLSVIQGFGSSFELSFQNTNDSCIMAGNYTISKLSLNGENEENISLTPDSGEMIVENLSSQALTLSFTSALDQTPGTYEAIVTYNSSLCSGNYSVDTHTISVEVVARKYALTTDVTKVIYDGKIGTDDTVTFKIKNNGNVNLTDVVVSDTIDSKYNATYTTANTFAVLRPGEEKSITLRISIPQDESSRLRVLGDLKIESDHVNLTRASFFQERPTGMLEITDFDVEVKNPGSSTKKDSGIKDGDTINRDAEPGAKVTFKIEVTNNFDEDIEIQDITATITIRDIDDGDDLEDESNSFDLRDGRDKRIDMEFEIPYEVEEDTYEVNVFVEGEDEDGTNHEIEWTIYLNVNKERTALILQKASLESETLKCFRNTNLDVTALNIGSRDEDDARLVIYSEALGISTTKNFELTNDVYDDDSKQSYTIPINLPSTFKAGTYKINVVLYSNVDDEEDSEELYLKVEDCTITKNTNNNNENNADNNDNSESANNNENNNKDEQPIVVTFTQGTGVQATPVMTTASNNNDTLYIVLLIVAIVVIIILILWIIAMLTR